MVFNNKLEWDGTDIGICVIQEKFIYGRENIYNIYICKYAECVYGTIKKYDDGLEEIIEKIKDVLGVPPRRYHIIELDQIKYYLYFHAINKYFELVYETPINKIAKTHEILKDVQIKSTLCKNIVFMDICNFKNMKTTNIRIRNIDETYETILYGPYVIGNEDTIIPKTICDLAFEMNGDFIWKNYEYDTNYEKLFYVKKNIKKIIEEINNEYLWYVDVIMRRLLKYVK